MKFFYRYPAMYIEHLLTVNIHIQIMYILRNHTHYPFYPVHSNIAFLYSCNFIFVMNKSMCRYYPKCECICILKTYIASIWIHVMICVSMYIWYRTRALHICIIMHALCHRHMYTRRAGNFKIWANSIGANKPFLKWCIYIIYIYTKKITLY